MFAGNTEQNPGSGSPLLVVLAIAGAAFLGYKIFGKKTATSQDQDKTCPDGEVWNEAAGKCIPKFTVDTS